MNSKALISIIVPVYNVNKYIKKCVNSITSQTYSNLEIILVDDGSKDTSGDICDELAKNDSRIKVIHKVNGGLSDARNCGIDIASGKYIGFVDGDDYIAPQMMENMLLAIERHHAAVAMCGRFVVDEEENIEKKMFTLDEEKVFDGKTAIRYALTYNGCDFAAWDKLYKKSLFDGVRYPLGVMSEDYQVTPMVLSSADKIVHVASPFYYYVQRRGSITKQEFTEKRVGVLEQVNLMSNSLLKKYPDISKEVNYFKGKHLIMIQRYALKNNCKHLLPSMIEVSNACIEEADIMLKNELFSSSVKVKYLIKNIMLKIKIKIMAVR